ncbi:glycosyltransferase family 2 protein [Acidimangrovimonas sediminis]|uniref:glycosyltransferase family 2 protein n=1 Tax=Acidimangrovimonas sediminis TaxID=2056283 RepID=UPI000C802245|nr:glycosyltransferase family 2 protein [Acidimangrovimonas sediminis]
MNGRAGPPATSVVVVSRHRPEALHRCLCALSQQDHPRLEVIVVADPQACAALHLLSDSLRIVPFDEANISAARNLGLAHAAGEVVAFIDDDAAAEPTWASRLAAPFADPRVAAATGFVRGRNGISYQWKAATVDRFGEDTALAVDEGAVTLLPGDGVGAVKTQGTNMAFRADTLRAAGGFDPALRFYLDEAHVNLTLAAAGHLTAVVPGAQVHHGFAASARRRADRAPTDLTEIGASVAVFLRRHAAGEDPAPVLDRLRAAQRRRLVAMMVDGRLSPPDVPRLLATLETGLAEGVARPLPAPAPIATRAAPFRPLPGTGPRAGLVVSGRPWIAARLARTAAAGVAAGRIVTLILLGPSARPLTMRYDPAGYWILAGGLFGRAERAGPRPRITRFSARVARESARIGGFRPVAAPGRNPRNL